MSVDVQDDVRQTAAMTRSAGIAFSRTAIAALLAAPPRQLCALQRGARSKQRIAVRFPLRFPRAAARHPSCDDRQQRPEVLMSVMTPFCQMYPLQVCMVTSHDARRYYWLLRGADNVTRAIGYYRKAVERAPGSARAYAGLSMAYEVLPNSEPDTTDSLASLVMSSAGRGCIRR